MTTFPVSKAISGASALYAGYALARPDHLDRALATREGTHRPTARIFGIRDLVTSSVAFISGNRAVITAAMGSRVAYDIGDCLALRTEARTGDARRKVTGVTLGWAALNAAAYAVDVMLAGRTASRS